MGWARQTSSGRGVTSEWFRSAVRVTTLTKPLTQILLNANKKEVPIALVVNMLLSIESDNRMSKWKLSFEIESGAGRLRPKVFYITQQFLNLLEFCLYQIDINWNWPGPQRQTHQPATTTVSVCTNFMY